MYSVEEKLNIIMKNMSTAVKVKKNDTKIWNLSQQNPCCLRVIWTPCYFSGEYFMRDILMRESLLDVVPSTHKIMYILQHNSKREIQLSEK